MQDVYKQVMKADGDYQKAGVSWVDRSMTSTCAIILVSMWRTLSIVTTVVILYVYKVWPRLHC